MQEICNNCFGSKICNTILRQAKTGKHECRKVTAIFRHSCLPVFAWWRVVLSIFDPKQLLRVSFILWCYYPKCYPIIFENASLWCFIAIFNNNVSLNIRKYIIYLFKYTCKNLSNKIRIFIPINNWNCVKLQK